MNRSLARIALVAAIAAAFTACPKREPATVATPTPAQTPEPSPTPEPTPAPTPPIVIPGKRMETAKLFNGIELRATVETEWGAAATTERETPSSYTLDLALKVRVPKAHADITAISRLNAALPELLPGLPAMMGGAKVSESYEAIYKRKVASLEYSIARLDTLLSRHNFYDCETILELRHPQSKRRALFIQADMDVDMDGSDSDRVPITDGSSLHFQPTTSYRWPKRTTTPNPFLAGREARLKQAEEELGAAGTTAARKQELKAAISTLRLQIGELKKFSYLVSAVDPYMVLPGSMPRNEFTPKLGDYCVIIHGRKLLPTIFGDVGPRTKAGEGSLRLCREINAAATAYNRPVSDLKVTYLVFPGTADSPAGPPDYELWVRRCTELLNDIGGFQGELHMWEDLTKPKPTPTPTPTPTATPAPAATPSATPEPAPATSPAP